MTGARRKYLRNAGFKAFTEEDIEEAEKYLNEIER